MKKLFMMLALASMSVVGMAQDNGSNTPTLKHSVATNSFGSNWFIQANVVGSAFYGSQELDSWNLSNSPLKGYRNNLGFSVAVGKWFTPGIGLRTKVNAAWGRTIFEGGDKEKNANKYWMAQEQVLLNLSNLICGYSETRVWNFIPYFGGGIARNMSYNTYSMNLGVGILNTFRLSNKWAVNLDVNFNAGETDMDGEAMPSDASRFSLGNMDRILNVEVGLTYNLGKGTWNKTPDVDALKALSQAEIDALNAQLASQQAENGKLRGMLTEAQNKPAETKYVKEVYVAPVSVFFNIESARIASKKDLQNVKELVEIAKANGSTVVVAGYADSKTGSADYNQKLSQKRAETVKKELVKMGLSESQIVAEGKGGVNVLSPISYNRRATVTIQK